MTTGETKKDQVKRLECDEIIRNVVVRGISWLPEDMVEHMTQADGRTPRRWFVKEAARYYENWRGIGAFSYEDAPALAMLRLRSAMLEWKEAHESQ